MKPNQFFYLSLSAVLLLASCSKEKSFEKPSEVLGTLLVKIESVSSERDTVITNLSYDDKKRLVTAIGDGKEGGGAYHSFKKYVWDNANRVVQILDYAEGVAVDTEDTTRRFIHYPDATTKNFDYIITTLMAMGEPAFDSSAFRYNGDQMKVQDSYISIPGYAIDKVNYIRSEFTYNGSGDVGRMDLYSTDLSDLSGPLEYTSKTELTYSNDLDYAYATDSPAQNYLFAGIPNKTGRYIQQLIATDQNGTTDDITITYVYVKGANGKPASGTSTLQPDNLTATIKLFYQ